MRSAGNPAANSTTLRLSGSAPIQAIRSSSWTLPSLRTVSRPMPLKVASVALVLRMPSRIAWASAAVAGSSS